MDGDDHNLPDLLKKIGGREREGGSERYERVYIKDV